MAKTPKQEDVEGDPGRGDALLKRMLKTKPKPHKEMKKGKGQSKEVRREGKPSD